MEATATVETLGTPGTPGTEVAAVAALERAADALAALDPAQMAGAELSETIVALHRLRGRLEGVEARLTAAWDARMVWADDGARSGAAWLAHRCRIPVQAARALVRVARRLRATPRTEAALVAGEVGAHQAKRLARAATRDPEAFERDEAMLLGHARALRSPHFDRAVTYWEQLADPDGTERDARERDEARRLHLSKTFEGTWVLDGVSDTVGGAVVSEALARIDDELFEADWAEARAEKGEGVTPLDLPRTPAQRRFDALVVMAVRALTAPRDGKAPRPLFTVLVDYPSLAGRVLELADGTVLTPGQLVPWLGEADVERVVFDGPSRVLDVGVRRRLFSGATRRAVEVRDRFCTGFACEEPSGRCDIDHVVPYAAGGPTVQGNGRAVCPRHHPGRRKQRPRGPDPP